MTKTSISFLAIYDRLEHCIINDVSLSKHKQLIKIFNKLYSLHLKNICQLANYLWFEIGQFKPTKDFKGYKIGCSKDVNRARKRLDRYLLSFVDL